MKKLWNLDKYTLIIFITVAVAAVAIGLILVIDKSNADFTNLDTAIRRVQTYIDGYILDSQQQSKLSSAVSEADQLKKEFFKNQKKIDDTAEKLNAMCDSLVEEIFLFDSEKTMKFRLVDRLVINGAECIYNIDFETFYFPLDINRLTDITLDMKGYGQTDESNIHFRVADTQGNILEPPYNFTLNQRYVVKAVSKSYRYDYNIVFTGLPVIQINDINLPGIDTGNDYKPCSVVLTDPAYTDENGNIGHQYFVSGGAVHVRGGIARSFPKKSYEMMLTDQDGNEMDVSLLGMRSDSEYILDAMYIDQARMRTRVCNDLWNDFAVMPLYASLLDKQIYTGTRGKFVEVYSNGEYMGLYCLTEKIDRKQLQLKKYNDQTGIVSGVLYKGRNWDANVRFYEWYPTSGRNNWWGGFEQKYPDEKNYWDPISDFVKFFVNTKDDTVFAQNVSRYIDTDTFVDYTIMLCISYAYDNTGKNAYWGSYDVTDPQYGKVFLTIWDMDATFGRSWDGTPLDADDEWIDGGPEHKSALFSRLVETNADGFRDKMKARWNELKADKLSPERLKSYFDYYFDLLDKSGAFARESAKWEESGLDMESEREYIRKWISERFAYIDNYISNEM